VRRIDGERETPSLERKGENMRTAILAAGSLLAVIGAAPVARANLITNGSFEQLNLAATPMNPYGFVTLHPGSTSLSGWTVTGNTVDVVPGTYWQASAGNWSIDLTGTPGVGAVTQVVGTGVGTTYKLSFDLAVNPENLTNELALVKKLRATVQSSTAAVIAQVDYPGLAGVRTKGNMQYVTETFYFTATTNLTAISFAALAPTMASASQIYTGPVIDNVNLVPLTGNTPSVPEPASLAVLGVGGAALVSRRRR
jgi:choice-of-anchor C domain-containing protein